MQELIYKLYEEVNQQKGRFKNNHLYYIFTDKGIGIYTSKELIKEGQVIESSKIRYH